MSQATQGASDTPEQQTVPPGFAKRHFGSEMERLSRFTPEQRAAVFYELESRWCWDCGVEQASEDHAPDCPASADTREPRGRELICMRCGRDYPIWSADNELWNAVERNEDGTDDDPFICPTCFMIQAAFMGVENAFHVSRSDHRERPADARSLEKRIETALRALQSDELQALVREAYENDDNYHPAKKVDAAVLCLRSIARALTERPDADLFPDPHPGITPEHIYEIFGAGWNHGRYTKYETVEELASGYSDAARAYAAKYLAQAHGSPRMFFVSAGKAVDVPGQFPTPGAILEVTEPIDRGLNLAAAICEKRAESLPPTEANEALKCAEAIRSYLSESHGAAQAETEGGVE